MNQYARAEEIFKTLLNSKNMGERYFALKCLVQLANESEHISFFKSLMNRTMVKLEEYVNSQ